MLYPTITFDPVVAATNPNLLPSGMLALILVNMRTVAMSQIIVSQVSLTEDFGMQGWLSEEPGGIPLTIPAPGTFPLSRFTPRPLIVLVAGHTPPPDSILAPVIPGQYWLNILNLTNTPAMFAFAQTTLA